MSEAPSPEEVAFRRRQRLRRLFYSAGLGLLTANELDFKIPFYIPEQIWKLNLSAVQGLIKYNGHQIFEFIRHLNLQDAAIPAVTAAALFILYKRFAGKVTKEAMSGFLLLPFRLLWKTAKNVVPITIVVVVGGVAAAAAGYSAEVLTVAGKVGEMLQGGGEAILSAYRHWDAIGPVAKGAIGAGCAYVSFKVVDMFTAAARAAHRRIGPLTAAWKKNALHVGGSLAVGALWGRLGLPLPDYENFMLPLFGAGAALFCLDQTDFVNRLDRLGGRLARGTARAVLAVLPAVETTAHAVLEAKNRSDFFKAMSRKTASGLAARGGQARRDAVAYARANPRDFLFVTAAVAGGVAVCFALPVVVPMAKALLAVAPGASTLVTTAYHGLAPAAAIFAAVAAIRGFNGPAAAGFRNAANALSQRLLFGVRPFPEPLPAEMQAQKSGALLTAQAA